MLYILFIFFFFLNDTATTEIYTLSLHDALPIFHGRGRQAAPAGPCRLRASTSRRSGSTAWTRADRRMPAARHSCRPLIDRKSTRLNSSHSQISYAVFCLKKKKLRDGYVLQAT